MDELHEAMRQFNKFVKRLAWAGERRLKELAERIFQESWMKMVEGGLEIEQKESDWWGVSY